MRVSTWCLVFTKSTSNLSLQIKVGDVSVWSTATDRCAADSDSFLITKRGPQSDPQSLMS